MKSIALKGTIYNMVNEVEQNTLSGDINVKYNRPKFVHRVLANLLDFIIFAIVFVALFILTRYVVGQTPEHSRVFSNVNKMRLESGMYYKKDNGEIVDIVSYMNSSSTLTNEGKVKLSEQSINKFFVFEKANVSDTRYNKIADEYNTNRLASTFTESGVTYHLFLVDGEGDIVKNDELYDGGYRYLYRNFYLNYIDKYFQGYFATTPIYYDNIKILLNYLIWVDVPIAFVTSIILVYYVPTLFFRRGRKTLGKALYRIGTIDSRFLSPSFGRNTAKWALFLLEMILGIASVGIVFVLSFTMMVFSKNKQGFPDYMLGLQEIDVSNNKIYFAYEEIELNNVERHKKPTDFRLIQRP